jgi:hypothetical protein
MRLRLDQSARNQLPQRLAHRRARHRKAPRDVGFVERRARRQRAAHDFIRELQAQLLRASDFCRRRLCTVDAANRRLGCATPCVSRNIVKAHVF